LSDAATSFAARSIGRVMADDDGKKNDPLTDHAAPRHHAPPTIDYSKLGQLRGYEGFLTSVLVASAAGIVAAWVFYDVTNGRLTRKIDTENQELRSKLDQLTATNAQLESQFQNLKEAFVTNQVQVNQLTAAITSLREDLEKHEHEKQLLQQTEKPRRRAH
jgi:septal ring factor EnvC (AmiA/AmiB activator)